MWGFLNLRFPSLPGSDLMAITRSENVNLHVSFLQWRRGPRALQATHKMLLLIRDINYVSLNSVVVLELRAK